MPRRKGPSLSQQIGQLRGIVGAAQGVQLREPVRRRPLPGTTAGPLERSVGPPLRRRPKGRM